MKKSTKSLLYLSIALNCFFVIAFTFLCIYKWNSITTRLEKLFTKNQPSEKSAFSIQQRTLSVYK